LLVVREIGFALTCKFAQFPAHANGSTAGPPVLLHCQILRPADYSPLKSESNISLFRCIGASRRGRIGLGCHLWAKIGVKIASFLESCITTRRPPGQPLWAVGRTRAKPHHTGELGRLPLFSVATGSIKCSKSSNCDKIILSGERQRFSPA
jgi:hypothetical protein